MRDMPTLPTLQTLCNYRKPRWSLCKWLSNTFSALLRSWQDKINLLAHFNPDPTIFQIRGMSAFYVLQRILLLRVLVIQVTETHSSVLNIEPT